MHPPRAAPEQVTWTRRRPTGVLSSTHCSAAMKGCMKGGWFASCMFLHTGQRQRAVSHLPCAQGCMVVTCIWLFTDNSDRICALCLCNYDVAEGGNACDMYTPG